MDEFESPLEQDNASEDAQLGGDGRFPGVIKTPKPKRVRSQPVHRPTWAVA
jgi:hypothetical protein